MGNDNQFPLTQQIIGKVGVLLGDDFDRFGRQLGLSAPDVKNIKANEKNVEAKAVAVIDKWIEMNGISKWKPLKKELLSLGYTNIVKKIEEEFINNDLSSQVYICPIECQIPYGCVFKFDLKDVCCSEVKFKLHRESNNWHVIKPQKHESKYYLTKIKNGKLFVKVEKLPFQEEKIDFKFSFQDSNRKCISRDCSVTIKGKCRFELHHNGFFIATPEPIFNNEFSKNIKPLESLDWRKKKKICLDKVPDDEPIELFAKDYFDRNFPDFNDVIHVSPSINNNDNLDFIVSKFISLFTVNNRSQRVVFHNYCLRQHADLLGCDVENIPYYNDENRIIIFLCKSNLIMIAHVATSTDNLKLEYKNCLNDVILFVNVNYPLISNSKLIILGIVVLPLHDRKDLKEELFFHFSESFHSLRELQQIFFLCKDDFEDESLESWWRSVVEYCYEKVIPQNNEILFKKLISLAMMPMAYVNHCYPTLESNTEKQIQSLILNVEQRNAINDKALKKIITGGYGSGKSIVGKEIVKNCITQNSENPFTMYYICCNHFSLYECHMKEFVDSFEKASNVEVVCDNLYNLWKNAFQNKNISHSNILLPNLLEFLADTKDSKVAFILEELSEEYVNEEYATQIKQLFTSKLKDSLVVFIPESVSKNRELITNGHKHTLQRNFFQEEVIGMKVISLNKSMRVTECNKKLIDIAQKTIYETKSVFKIPQQNIQHGKNYVKDYKKYDLSHFDLNDPLKVNKDNNYPSVENKKDLHKILITTTNNKTIPLNSKVSNDKTVKKFTDFKSDQSSERIENKTVHTNVVDFHDIDLDFMAKNISKNTKNDDTNNYMETEYVFKSGIIGHSIKGEKPKVVYLPFYDLADKQSVKLLSIMLEKLCFNVLRKTVVICNNMEEVQSIAYAIDIIEDRKAVTYSPHLQQISPSLKTKIDIKKKLTNKMNILVTDCKGFSGVESESVIVFVSPEEIYHRHLLVDAISRSNSHLTVFVKNCKDNKEPLDKTIGNVLNKWSEEKIVEEITIATSNTKNQTSMDVFFVINKNCKAFIDRGSTNDFEKYKENSQFKILHENNTRYETMALNLSNKVKPKFENVSTYIEPSNEFFSKCYGEISYKIGRDWYRLGKHLGLSDSDLDNIDSDNKVCYDKADNVLKKWKQIYGHLSWEDIKKGLEAIKRCDIVDEIERKFGDYLLSLENISTIECRIPHGCVFKFDLEDEFCREVEFELCSNSNNWKVINYKKHICEYYLTKKKNGKLFVKVENLRFENEKINFKFSFQDSKKNSFQHHCSVHITGICNFELRYSGLFIATPEPIFDNKFSKNIKILKSLDWRKINNICINRVFDDKSIESFALDYFDRNFPDFNDVIHVSSFIANNDNLKFIVSKFISLFTVNNRSLRAVLPGYHLRYHASLLKCNVENFNNYNDESRIIIYYSKLNLVIIAHVATSTDNLKLVYENCLNDVILFVNVNYPLIHNINLIILGIVVLPLHDRKDLKEELFFHFSESFDLDQILFLCKDDIEDENFESWWRSVAAYCIKKVNKQMINEILFKKLISLTMMSMAKVDHSYPTLESDTQKQIQSLILNNEQRNAINDKALKKIITGGYGSGKSIVGKEIVKNCITQNSENPFTMYYICCNHFSLYECHMKEFVDSFEKTSNVEVVCDNLYNLWKNAFQNKNISNSNISLPDLLEYLADTNDGNVAFVLEELSEEYVNEEDATQIKHLFTSKLKECLVVFIPESVSKNRELVTNEQKQTLQRNFFQEEVIGMKVISLNKSMRVTKCNKLLIDIAQRTICETKSVCTISNQDLKILQENKKNKLFEVEDFMAKIIAKGTKNVDPNNYIETEYVFKSSIFGHSIIGEKPKVVYLPFYDIADKQSVKILSIMLEKLCFNVLRKTVVICSNMEEVQSIAYAIDIIKRFQAVTYAPHLQQISPSLKTKIDIKKKLRIEMDILVTDCKGFSGAESESVIVFVSPEEVYHRHLLVDAISRSNSHLTVFVKNCKENKEPLDKTIRNVLNKWSEEKIVEVIKIETCNTKNRKSKDVFFVINEKSKAFIDRGSTVDFEKCKKKSQFEIFNESNFMFI